MAFRALICIASAAAGLLSAWPAAAQTADAILARDGKAEEAFCAQVPAEGHSSCIITRDYVVVCKAVVNKELSPIELPAYPRGNFKIEYLRDSEKPVVLDAWQQSTAALEALNAKYGKGSAGN